MANIDDKVKVPYDPPRYEYKSGKGMVEVFQEVDPYVAPTATVTASAPEGIFVDHDKTWNYKVIDNEWYARRKTSKGKWANISRDEKFQSSVDKLDKKYPKARTDKTNYWNIDFNELDSAGESDIDISTSAARELSSAEKNMLNQLEDNVDASDVVDDSVSIQADNVPEELTGNVVRTKVTPKTVSETRKIRTDEWYDRRNRLSQTRLGKLLGIKPESKMPQWMQDQQEYIGDVSEDAKNIMINPGAQIEKGPWLGRGSAAAQQGKQMGLSMISQMITPETWLRTDKEGLRTDYGGQDVAGRGLQGVKGIGRILLGDWGGGLGDIGSAVIGGFTDKAQVDRDRKTASALKRNELLNKMRIEEGLEHIDSEMSEDEMAALSQEQASKPGEQFDKYFQYAQMFMDKGGVVGDESPVPMQESSDDVLSYLSDDYKSYLLGKLNPMGRNRKYRGGGMVHGPSHAKGGVKFNVGGQVHELEGGEAVINKKSTEMYKDVLSQINQAGGGKKFSHGGLIKRLTRR